MTPPKLDYAEYWRGTHAGVSFQIVHWGVGSSYNPKGTWNYYLYIHEKDTKKFNEYWLADIEYQLDNNCPRHVTNAYESVPLFDDLDLHGGITFYEKHGHLEGHRSVEIGCDYSHLRDMEAGYPADLQMVLSDCMSSCEHLAALLSNVAST